MAKGIKSKQKENNNDNVQIISKGDTKTDGKHESDDISRLKNFYEEELKRKDKIIDNLLQERDILIRTALKQAERNAIVRENISFRKKTRDF